MLDVKVLKAPYYVSFDTFVLEPYVYDDEIITRVIERRQEFLVKEKPLQIVKNSINLYGGSFKQATHYAKQVIGNYHKTPIIVAHDYGIPYIFIPTLSPNSDHNVWIASHSIDNYSAVPQGCMVYLENNQAVKVNVSFNTIARQYSFANTLGKRFDKVRRHLNNPHEFFDLI